MIHIVTGKINSGKSTTISDLYNKIQQGDGFISVKRMHYHKVHGYDIMQLSTKHTLPLVIREEYARKEHDIVCQIGPYLFLKDTLTYIEDSFRQMIASNIEPLFLDEIGQLELYGKCFDTIFKEIIQSNSECYITVREDLVEEILKNYGIKDYKIITI